MDLPSDPVTMCGLRALAQSREFHASITMITDRLIPISPVLHLSLISPPPHRSSAILHAACLHWPLVGLTFELSVNAMDAVPIGQAIYLGLSAQDFTNTVQLQL